MHLWNVSTFTEIGAVGGALFYGWLSLRRHAFVSDALLFQAIICAAFFAASIHLTLCAFYPENLVHFKTSQGGALDTGGCQATLGEFHEMEVFAAGLGVMVMTFKGLVSIKRRALLD